MVFASVALALLDFVGVAALVPVLLLILSEDATFSYPVMRWLYEAGSFTSFGTFVTAVCVAVLLVIIVKSILTLTVSNAVSKYLLSLYRHYSTRMFDIYLSKGLLFIRNNHTSQLINNVNGVCLRFTDGVLGQLFSIVTEIILLGLVAAALLWYDPRLVLLALAVFLPLTLVYALVFRAQDERERPHGEQALRGPEQDALRNPARLFGHRNQQRGTVRIRPVSRRSAEPHRLPPQGPCWCVPPQGAWRNSRSSWGWWS